MIQEIDTRLFEWGDYMRIRGDFGLGYPHRNILHKAMREGAGASQRAGRPEEQVPEHIEEIEQSLVGVGGSLRQAAIARYICRDVDKVAAEKLEVSIASYRHRINHLHYYIAGVLKLRAM